MPRATPANDYERRLLENIRRFGWQSTNVLGDAEDPSFAYTIGFQHSFGVPEVLVTGLDGPTAHGLLSEVAAAVREGSPLGPGRGPEVRHNGHPCAWQAVSPERYGEYVLSALWYYEGEPFQVVQLVWPDGEGRFPGEPGAEEVLAKRQPLLG